MPPCILCCITKALRESTRARNAIARKTKSTNYMGSNQARKTYLPSNKNTSRIFSNQLKSCQFTLSRNAPPDFCKYKHIVSTSSKQETGSKQHLLVMILYVLLQQAVRFCLEQSQEPITASLRDATSNENSIEIRAIATKRGKTEVSNLRLLSNYLIVIEKPKC